jgi:serine/threonine protein kinase
MAPEVHSFQSYNCKADIFSIGALTYDMANGDPFVRVQKKNDWTNSMNYTETTYENFFELNHFLSRKKIQVLIFIHY